MSLNNILSRIGEFGPFQIRVYLLLNALSVLRCCQMFLLVFIADKPQWNCLLDDLILDGNKKFPCLNNGSVCSNVQFSGEFTSIASEWRLICDKEYKRSLANALVMTGCLVGAVLFGGMADKRGRKSSIVLLHSVASVSCIASGLAQTYELFVLFRFITAVVLSGCSTAVFVLVSEIVGQSSKDMLLTAYQASYSFGYVLLSLFAYFIRDWRHLTITVSAPIVFCSMFLLQTGLCESPHWLVENGRIDECKQLLREIAKTNGADISEAMLEKLPNELPNKVDTKQYSKSRSILTQPGYLKKVVTFSIIWLSLGMMYLGLSFVSGSLSSNKYLSFALCGVVEIPALSLSVWVIKSGRRIPLCTLALITSFACLACASLQNGEQSQVGVYITATALLGKFGVAACYNIIYIFSAENFGASVRSFTLGLFSVVSSLGGILAPLVIGLDAYDKRIPMVSFGIGAIIAAGFVMTLPETAKANKRDKKTN